MGRFPVEESCNCTEDLCRYIGQTVTIFTESGGLSGSGFTGVLISVDCKCIRLLTAFGAPPACPVGSACGGFDDRFNNNGWSNSGFNWGCDEARWNNGYPFGSLCVIPTARVVSYTVIVI